MNILSNGAIRPHSSKLEFLFRLSDCAIIALALIASLYVRGVPLDEGYILSVLIAIISFSFVGSGLGAYRSQRGVSFRQWAWPIMVAWFFSIFVLFSLAYFFKASGEYSRIAIGAWFIVTPMALISWRLTVRSLLSHFRSKGYNTRSVAIVGAVDAGNRIGKVIVQTPSFGLVLKGFFDNRQRPSDRTPEDLVAPVLGGFDDLVRRAHNGEFDLIYIALALKGEKQIAELIEKLADTTASVHLVPDFFVYNLLHSHWINLGSVPTISVHESPCTGVDGWLKRLEDIVLSSFILIFIAVPMLVIAAGVKLSSPGPVLFKQRRYGVDGKAIRVWKFRSMTVCDNGDTVVQAKKGDIRVTPFGAFLRRTSLDELPQFMNVLLGEMSIVGPRPHAVAHNEEYRKLISGYMLRHKVKPGITGWAQVNGWRGETDTLDKMEKRVEYDLNYIRNWSLWWDLKIVFRTVFTGFSGKNAY
ncbi:MAG: undecaprenyl-phosphate glucose phosphotransferase [Gammaproteobacteria bacterium]|nr:undecaprenyl-phosphate glucose phosphotransferase [Gammaproteobacteria bacterium]